MDKKVLHMQYYISHEICLTCKTNFPALSLMKQLITIFLLILPISAYAENVLNYKPDIEKCDKQFKHDMDGNLTAAEMIVATDSQVVCYESVAHKIIDKYYSKQSETMKNNLRESITAYTKTANDMYNPDRCYNECGNLTALMADSPILDFVKSYIEHLTNAVTANF